MIYALKNYLRLFKMSFKWVPHWVILTILQSVVVAVNSIVSSVLALRIIYSGIIGEMIFHKVIVRIIIIGLFTLLVGFVNSIYYGRFDPIGRHTIAGNLSELINNKASEVDLNSYNDHEFLDLHSLMKSQFFNKAIDVVIYTSHYLSNFIAIIICIGIASTIDLKVFFIASLFIPVLIVMNFKKKKTKLSLVQNISKYERRKDYFKSIFHSKEYAEELRLYPIINCLEEDLDTGLDRLLQTIKGPSFILFTVDCIYNHILDVVVYFGMLWYISSSIVAGQYPISSLLPSIALMYQLVMRTNSLMGIIPSIYDFSDYVNKFDQFIGYRSSVEKRTGQELSGQVNLIELRDVSFRYTSRDQFALKNINIKINKGEKVAFVGENGAGKSTLTKLLLGLYDTYDGEILVDGVELRKIDIDSYRRCFSNVFQDFNYYACTLAENVVMDEKTFALDDEIKTALDRVGLTNTVQSLERGIDTPLTKEFNKNGVELSKGQYQRMAISRAYLRNSDIIIMDEPTSALDPIAEYEMYKNLREISADKTVIVVSHRLFTIRGVDKVFYFENGSVVESGSHDELLQFCGKYAIMYETQMMKYEVSNYG